MDKNLLALPNVSLNTKFTDKMPLSNIRLNYDVDGFQSLLWDLATGKPMWAFYISSGSMGLNTSGEPNGSLRVRDVQIKQDGELLGTVSSEYHGGSKKIFVANRRIEQQRSRRNSGKMVTSDYKRAYREIIKNFYRKDPQEVITDAYEALRSNISNMSHNHYRKMRDATITFKEIAGNIAFNNLGMFLQLPIIDDLKTDLQTNFTLAQENDRAHNELSRLIRLLNPVEAEGAAAIVVTLGSSYILSYKGPAEIIASDELPEELRAPLGMLKLSETNTLVDGIGVRVSENTFLVLPGEMK
jgi:hypothetical protein